MGVDHYPTEGGSGGKRGHSNMEHWDDTAAIKDAARRRRRSEDRRAVEEVGRTVVLDLDLFCQLAQDLVYIRARPGATARIQRSPDDGRTRTSAWLSIEVGSVGGQLTLWDSGEGELAVYPEDPSREPLLRHLDGVTDDDLPELLATFENELLTT